MRTKAVIQMIAAIFLLSAAFSVAAASATSVTDFYVSGMSDLWWSGATTSDVDVDGYIVPPDESVWSGAVLCWEHPNWYVLLDPAGRRDLLFASPSADWIWRSVNVTDDEALTGDIVFFKKQIDIPGCASSIVAKLIITADNAYYFYVDNPGWSGTPAGFDGFATGYGPTDFYYSDDSGNLYPLNETIPSVVAFWSSIEEWDISSLLHTGENWLQIVAINENSTSIHQGNPAGLIYKVLVTYDCIIGIDIKPGHNPNTVNPRSKGLLRVAILGTETFDVAEIDPATIQIGTVHVVRAGYGDVNHDKNTDLIVFFSISELVKDGVLTKTTTELELTASLYDGTDISGVDSIRVVPPAFPQAGRSRSGNHWPI